MSSQREAIRDEVEALYELGAGLYREERAYWAWDEEDPEERPKPASFNSRYNRWYSQALPLIRQLAPDRYEEFQLYFRDTRIKDVSWQTYTIQQHVNGLHPAGMPTARWAGFALTKFASQIHILSSLSDRLDSVLGDVVGVLQAELGGPRSSVHLL